MDLIVTIALQHVDLVMMRLHVNKINIFINFQPFY